MSTANFQTSGISV